MIKKFMFLLALSMLLVSCGTRSDKAPQVENKDFAVLTVANFDSLAGNYVGKEVQLEGLVDHVCRHGGKRMFLVRTDGEGRVKVTTGETIPGFDVTLEGSDVVVTGVVDELRIDEQYLAEWEKELDDQAAAESEEPANEEPANEEPANEEPAAGEEQAQGEHAGMGEKADQGVHTEAYQQIQDYRAQIAASDKGYLSFYSIICSEFKQKEN